MSTKSTPSADLSRLLVSLFNCAELRNFIATLDGGQELLPLLPDGPASLQELVHGAIRALRRHGRLDVGFFEALVRAFPRRSESILRVAAVWRPRDDGLPCVGPEPGALDGMFADRESGCLTLFFSS